MPPTHAVEQDGTEMEEDLLGAVERGLERVMAGLQQGAPKKNHHISQNSTQATEEEAMEMEEKLLAAALADKALELLKEDEKEHQPAAPKKKYRISKKAREIMEEITNNSLLERFQNSPIMGSSSVEEHARRYHSFPGGGYYYLLNRSIVSFLILMISSPDEY